MKTFAPLTFLLQCNIYAMHVGWNDYHGGSVHYCDIGLNYRLELS